MKMRFWGIFLLFLFLPLFCYASSTVFGPTGLVTMPNAEGLKYKEFNVGLNYMPPYYKGYEDSDGNTIGQDQQGLFNYYANLGSFEGLELGFSGRGGREGVFINMKYYLISDTNENPLSMAIGLQNLSSFNDTGLYMVASKQLNMNFGLHFGFLGRFFANTSDTNMMFGMKYFLNEQWSLLIDTIGEQSVYAWNVGTQIQISPEFSLNMSGLNLLNPADRKNSVFVIGVSYNGFM